VAKSQAKKPSTPTARGKRSNRNRPAPARQAAPARASKVNASKTQPIASKANPKATTKGNKAAVAAPGRTSAKSSKNAGKVEPVRTTTAHAAPGKPASVKPTTGRPATRRDAVSAADAQTTAAKPAKAEKPPKPPKLTRAQAAAARAAAQAREIEMNRPGVVRITLRPGAFTTPANNTSKDKASKRSKANGEKSRAAATAAVGSAQPAQPPTPPPAPVTTDGKPKKNLAGFSSKELEEFRVLLLAKRRELVGDMSSMEREALRSAQGSNLSNLPLHMADMGTDNYEQEFTLGLVEKDRQLLREINSALAKIQDGRYGICEGTGKPISKARLEAQPWARFSIEHARMMERGMVRR
jgi:RNA polymerase-binding protein DksA